MRNSTMAVLKKGDGIFHPSCLAHGIKEGITINGVDYNDVLTDWFFDYGKLTQNYRLVEECPASANGLPCNPTTASCRINGSPTPPGPPAPPDACEAQIKADGCLTGDKSACEDC